MKLQRPCYVCGDEPNSDWGEQGQSCGCHGTLARVAKVIEAAKACVHGWSEDMSDGSTHFREPFNHTARALLHERVVALEGEEE